MVIVLLLVFLAEAAIALNYLATGKPFDTAFPAFVNNFTSLSLWTSSMQPESSYAFVTCQNNVGIAAAGNGDVLRRGRTGNMWINVSQPLVGVPRIEVMALNPGGCLIIASRGGVAASLDYGDSWVVVHPVNSSIVVQPGDRFNGLVWSQPLKMWILTMFRQASSFVDIFTSNFSCGGAFVLSKKAALPAHAELEFSLASSPVVARIMALSNSTVATSVDGVTWNTTLAPFNSSSSRPVVCEGEHGAFFISAFLFANKRQAKITRDFGQSWDDLDGSTDTSFAISACTFDYISNKWISSAFTASECKMFETSSPIASSSVFASGNVTNLVEISSIAVCVAQASRLIAGSGTVVSSTLIVGDLQLSPGSILAVPPGQMVVVTGSAFINGSSATVVAGTSAGIQELFILSASNIVGSFSEVSVTTIDASCSYAMVQNVNYNPSSVSVTVFLESLCNYGLSAGAIAGIVIGCVVLAVAAVLLIHVIYLKTREVQTRRANDDIRNGMLQKV